MKFDTVLEYQKIDHDLLEIESEVAKSKERAAFIGAKSKLEAATAAVGKLSHEAGELLQGYAKLSARADALKARLDEFDGMLDDMQDVSEADYYLKQIAAISDEIASLEKDAARDSEYDGKRIRKGEIMSLENGKIVATSNDLTKAAYRLARSMCKKDSSFVTVISGCDVSDEDAERTTEIIKSKCPSHVEVSHIRGGQPVYYYMISVE